MAISNFIPTIWSENLLTSLDKQYIGVANCNREFEGEIKSRGSSVKICGVGDISIGDYVKDTDMSSPQNLSDTVAELVINKAKYFNFQVDDIDRTQCNPKLLDAAMKNAASALANAADKHIFSLYNEAGNTVECDLDLDQPMDRILEARETLFKNGVLNNEDIVLEISPAIATLLFKDLSDKLSYNNELNDTGYIGNIAGCKVYVSNNIDQESGSVEYHKCFMRSKRAIAFAEQLSEVEAYRPEKRFADAVKGLHLYGAKVVYPNEFVCLDFRRRTED